jgi:hypothetical protein
MEVTMSKAKADFTTAPQQKIESQSTQNIPSWLAISNAIATIERAEKYLSGIDGVLGLIAEANAGRRAADLETVSNGLSVIVTAVTGLLEQAREQLAEVTITTKGAA